MAQLIAKCRLTGHYMFMGIEIGTNDLATLPETFARKFCPFCACEHTWYKRDAKLINSAKTARPVQQTA